MIAKVRIAPVERWCPAKQATIDWEKFDAAVNNHGGVIPILTETMKQSQWCDGRVWQHEQTDVNELRAIVGLPETDEDRWACEHMLELD